MGLVLKITGGIILAVVLLIAGCSALLAASADEVLTEDAGVVQVDAPSGMCWSGAIGDSSKDGCGPASFDIEGEYIIVANAHKQTPGDWTLTLTLTVGGDVKDTSETSAEFGLASVSE
jgi:hypothetical protein